MNEQVSKIDTRLRRLFGKRIATEGPRAFVTADDIHALLRRDTNYKARGGAYIARSGYGNVFKRTGWVCVGFVPSTRREARGRNIGAYRYQGTN